jgi:hypothetical protein
MNIVRQYWWRFVGLTAMPIIDMPKEWVCIGLKSAAN